MPKTEHVHKFKRHRFKSGNEVYFCALPDCNKKIMPALTLGKKCLCWRCGKEFIMTDYAIRLAKPHCDVCHVPKSSDKTREALGSDHDEHITITMPVEQINPVLSLSERLAALTQNMTTANDEEDI